MEGWMGAGGGFQNSFLREEPREESGKMKGQIVVGVWEKSMILNLLVILPKSLIFFFLIEQPKFMGDSSSTNREKKCQIVWGLFHACASWKGSVCYFNVVRKRVAFDPIRG